MAELGLRLEEAKQMTAALQAQIVPAQVATLGECRRSCVSCGSVLASKGHDPVRFRSLFGDVPLRVRRLLTCPCEGDGEVKGVGARINRRLCPGRVTESAAARRTGRLP